MAEAEQTLLVCRSPNFELHNDLGRWPNKADMELYIT